MVSYRSAFAAGENSSNGLTVIKLCFTEKESGESRFCYDQNGQLARIANSSITQGGVRLKDSFCPHHSASVFSGT
jgi:hypothetical protein